MADTHFPDEWLARSLEGVVTPELLVELREKAPPPARLWETLVAQKIASDDQILAALSTRFRLKVADLAQLDPAAKERVPEQVARRYHILPLRATDSYLEVATANPFDLDAEKALAFATAREIRMFLLAPSKIAERLDEMYRPEKAVDKLLEGMENSTSLEHLQDMAPDELVASEAEASQRPVVRLVDLIISEGILARSRATVKSLDSLGLNTNETEGIRRLLENHEGIILVTGPTGSGKTTTLYSCINQIKSEGVNIVTVEDPVEYRMQGIVQVQVQEKAGLTFASALRSILRQDPNVVLIGEIRDRETAQIAVQASLTGHLVLSTLHTNDAPNAVTRLVDIGVEAYKIAAALRGVVAQRLMRKLCPTCKEVWMEAPPDRLKPWFPKGTPLYRAAGCPDCAMTGYRGRFSIIEVLTVTPEVERRIAAGETAEHIATAARRAGMKSLWDSGVAHVIKGESTVDELMRVVDVPEEDDRTGEAAPAPAGAGRRVAGGLAASPRHAPAPGALGTPTPAAAPGEPLAAHFDLLEEPARPRVSGAHGEPLVKGLLVDDEDSLRKVMRDLLERDGYDVAEARDGVQALDQIDRVGPDIIVLDLNLPGLDGYGVLSHLRSRPATASIPVIVLTAKGDEDNEVRVFELGADDFLTKPFRARALSARLEAVLGRRR